MILDALATFSASQASTTSVAATDIIDTLAAGDAYVGAWFVTQVMSSVTQTGTASRMSFELQTCSEPTWGASDAATLVASAAFTTAQMTAGKFYAVRIPLNVKRYLRAYRRTSGTIGGSDVFTACVLSQFIVLDVNNIIGNKRYAL